VEQPHSGKARLRDLRRADRVVGARRLAPALRVQPRVALAEAHEIRFYPVGDSEIEMPPVRDLEEARGAKVLVVALRVDIGPELAACLRDVWLAEQILAAFDDRRGEAEVEAEQGRLPDSAFKEPVKHLLARPNVAGTNQPGRGIVSRLGDRNALVPPPLGAGPVDRNVRLEQVRHCERSEAIQTLCRWIASSLSHLAMTFRPAAAGARPRPRWAS
jgi:hypothetical protein